MNPFHPGDAVLVHQKEGDLHPLHPGVVDAVEPGGDHLDVRLGDGRVVRVTHPAVHPDPFPDDTGCWRCGRRVVPVDPAP